MCEIHVVKRFDGNLNQEDTKEFEKLMCFGSMGNSDAWGLFNSKYSIKNAESFNPPKGTMDNLLNDNWVVGHNRYATGSLSTRWNDKEGFITAKHENKDNHPFKLNTLTLVHNGVIWNDIAIREKFKIQSDIKTDSFVIIWLIDYYFNKFKHKQDKKSALIKAIQHTTILLHGTYSIFLYEKELDLLLYFKESVTSFAFKRMKNNILVGSTVENNFEYTFFNTKTKDIIYPEHKIIYQITNDFSNPLVKLVPFNQKPFIGKGKANSEEKKGDYTPTMPFNLLSLANIFLFSLVHPFKRIDSKKESVKGGRGK